MRMNCLVTGGAGFIGSHLCERLLKEGHEVVAIDNFDDYYSPDIKWGNVRDISDKMELRLQDIMELDASILRDTDVIFHLAAQPGVPYSIDNPIKCHKVNATGTLKLLIAARDAGVEKFIFASSGSAAGGLSNLASPYAASKAAAEGYCEVFGNVYGMDTVCLRYFNVYGPKMRPELAIAVFTGQALKGEPLTVYGDGSQVRYFTYIDDVIDMTIQAMRFKRLSLYDVGSPVPTRISSLADQIIQLTGSKSEIVYTKGRKHDVIDHAAPSDYLDRLVALSDGLRKYIEWAKSQLNAL